MPEQSSQVSADESAELRASVKLETKQSAFEELGLQKNKVLPIDTVITSVDSNDAEQPELTVDPNSDTRQTKSSGRIWLLLFCLVLVAGCWELMRAMSTAFLTNDWLAGVWILVFLLMLGLGIKSLVAEWLGLNDLRKQQAFQEQSQLLYYSQTIGQGQQFCQQQLHFLQQHSKLDTRAYEMSVADHHTDQEIICIFETCVIQSLDKKVTQIISQNASACAAMIAVSPFALLDMLIVLWRNLLMIQKISQVYGLHIGYWGRVKLIQRVFKLMLFAGASEILADAGSHALGGSITNKLSSKLAQGMGAGVITARIGLRAMQECRPMPFLALPKPGVANITQSIFKSLKNKIGSA